MGKVLLGVIAALGSLLLVDSLTCNSCSFGLAGFCILPTSLTCQTNTSVCYTSTAVFPSFSSFKGFATSGCLVNSTSCNTTTSSYLLGAPVNTTVTCCSTDKCNTLSVSAAPPSTSTTVSAVLAVAAAASLWGSML